MSDSEYDWAPGESPPLIGDHSLAKHDVLGRYLRTYVEVLTANPRMDNFRLTLVDGFAGGGTYTTERGEIHYGSPLQMIHAMRDAEALAKSRRKKPFQLDVEFFFIETKPRNAKALSAALSLDPAAANLQRQGKIHLLQGGFETHCVKITQHIASKGRTGRSIFLLDQYGYTDVPLGAIRSIVGQLRSAEFLLTFATDWLIDYISDRGAVNIARLQKMGYPPWWTSLRSYCLERNIAIQDGADMCNRSCIMT